VFGGPSGLYLDVPVGGLEHGAGGVCRDACQALEVSDFVLFAHSCCVDRGPPNLSCVRHPLGRIQNIVLYGGAKCEIDKRA